MHTLFLITVDCDLRAASPEAGTAGLHAVLDVLGEEGLAGRVTWFVNENDFRFTEKHQDFLREVVARGDTLGIHDHLEVFTAQAGDMAPGYDTGAVLAYCRAARDRVMAWLKEAGGGAQVRAHRNGCLAQAPEIYEALAELGYTVLSDVWPRHRSNDRSGCQVLDNSAIPLGIAPYRHDAHNYADYMSTRGQFLQVPVAALFLGAFRCHLLERWLEAAHQQGVDTAVFTWCVHPYEMLNDDRDAVSPGQVAVLRHHLHRLRTEYDVEFTSMLDLEEKMG